MRLSAEREQRQEFESAPTELTFAIRLRLDHPRHAADRRRDRQGLPRRKMRKIVFVFSWTRGFSVKVHGVKQARRVSSGFTDIAAVIYMGPGELDREIAQRF